MEKQVKSKLAKSRPQQAGGMGVSSRPQLPAATVPCGLKSLQQPGASLIYPFRAALSPLGAL